MKNTIRIEKKRRKGRKSMWSEKMEWREDERDKLGIESESLSKSAKRVTQVVLRKRSPTVQSRPRSAAACAVESHFPSLLKHDIDLSTRE
ncbi:hypothetical protein EVAR_16314_1 [Eumeta japonica]|uniref:Uncharacterized protein n=1 Tax=Eumeta variegata TaxID=151549 RepID=A0A4C1VFJ4_EUMVA|nr:hypothetical protein EVAR_16314_1 [Eumeta japonica]